MRRDRAGEVQAKRIAVALRTWVPELEGEQLVLYKPKRAPQEPARALRFVSAFLNPFLCETGETIQYSCGFESLCICETLSVLFRIKTGCFPPRLGGLFPGCSG